MVMYNMEKIMHRTQLYFDEDLFEQVKQQSSGMGLSVSAYIREAVRKELEREKAASQPVDFSGFSQVYGVITRLPSRVCAARRGNDPARYQYSDRNP